MNVSNQNLDEGKITEINSLIGKTCEALNVEAYIVGGFIRDRIIGIPIKKFTEASVKKGKEIDIITMNIDGSEQAR